MTRLSGVENLQELLRGRGVGTLGLGLLLGNLASLALLSTNNLSTADDLLVGVEAVHDTSVLERVLLLGEGSLVNLVTLGASNRLNFVRVDETGDVRVGDDVGGKNIVLLEGSRGLVGTVELVEKSESASGPDDETTNVTTGSELKQVQVADVDNLNTGKVAESLGDTIVLTIDNEGSTALTVAAVTDLTNTSTELARVGNLNDISVGVEGLEKSNSFLGLGESLNLVGNDKRNFLDLLNAVTAGQHKGGKCRSSQSRNGSESLLVLVDMHVPLAPGLGRSEHTTRSAHVTKSGLSSAVSTRAVNSWNSGNSTTSTPGLSRGLMTSLLRDGIGLTLVLGHVGVDKVDNVGTNGGLEDGGEGQSGARAVGGVNIDDRSGSCGLKKAMVELAKGQVELW
jgi:hypothetical protein